MSVKSCEKSGKEPGRADHRGRCAQEFEAAVEKAYRKMRRKINVPGFRPGKAPRKIIEGMYGAEVFFEEAINIAFPEAYEAAVKEQELQVVGYPAVEVEGQVTKDGFTFKATVPVYPEVKLGQYKGLSAEKEEVKVSASDVDTRLKALADRNTRLVSVDREPRRATPRSSTSRASWTASPLTAARARTTAWSWALIPSSPALRSRWSA